MTLYVNNGTVTLSENNVTMAPRPSLFPFVDIHGIELSRTMKGIVHALVMPPFVWMVNLPYIGVVRCAKEVNFTEVISISEMIDDASVESRSAIGNIGVTVNIPPVKTIGLSIHLPLVAIVGRTFRGIV